MPGRLPGRRPAAAGASRVDAGGSRRGRSWPGPGITGGRGRWRAVARAAAGGCGGPAAAGGAARWVGRGGRVVEAMGAGAVDLVAGMGAVWMRRMKMAKCGAAYLRVVCRVPAMANTGFAVCQIVGTLQNCFFNFFFPLRT